MRHMQKQNKNTIKLTFYAAGKSYPSGAHFVLPNMAAFVRDVTEYGNIGAVARRALKLPIPALIKLAWWNKTNFLKLAKKDFATGVSLLVQMELLQIAPFTPRMVVLTDQVTDLAVALGKQTIITSYLQSTKRLGLQSAIMTNNIVQTRSILGTLGLKHIHVMLPFNSQGYEMNPTQTLVEQTIQLMDPNYICAIVPLNTVQQDTYLKGFGIQQKVVEWF